VVSYKSKCLIKRIFDNRDVENSLKSTEKK
jgi:hypothetical protein